MPHQGNAWEREYKNPRFVTKGDAPQADTLRFLKYLKKEEKFRVEDRNVLDLGSGTGRNANYIADIGNSVIGIEISRTALDIAKARAKELGVLVDYRLGDIGMPYALEDNSVDVILDVTSSNSLDENSREVYLKEMNRVLKNGGYIFVRALCKDGNKNVKALLSDHPGQEKDTYVLADIGLVERVFSRADIADFYSKYFKILKLEKKSGYTTYNDRIYKRDYWLLYLKK
jgi:SAM-dependent methyltransferase